MESAVGSRGRGEKRISWRQMMVNGRNEARVVARGGDQSLS